MTMTTAVAAIVLATATATATAVTAAAAATTTATTTATTIASLATIESTGAAWSSCSTGPNHRGLVVAQWSSAVRERGDGWRR
jgi:hypothetical protein